MLLLAALFGFSALVVFYLSLRGRTVKVPNIVSLKEAVAQDELEDNGLIMQVRGRAPHQQIPFGAVADQSPAAGTVVKTGQLVRVTLSTGMPPPEPGRN
ncbi:MAG: PASTA domain-containing protein [Acidobacteriota bacterium]